MLQRGMRKSGHQRLRMAGTVIPMTKPPATEMTVKIKKASQTIPEKSEAGMMGMGVRLGES